MTRSDESDEVLISRKRGADAVPNLRGPKGPGRNRSSFNPKPVPKQAQQRPTHNSKDRRISQNSAQWSNDLHKGVGLPEDNSTDEPPTPLAATKENRGPDDTEDEAAELARLRKEIVLNAHKRTYHDANPEMLNKCRDGAGTDRFSKEYLEIANIRAVPQDNAEESAFLPGSSQIFSADPGEDKSAEQIEAESGSRMKLYRELYKKSPTAFPINTDDNDNAVLSPTPTKKHKEALDKIRNSRRQLAPEQSDDSNQPQSGKQVVKVLDNSWTDPSIVDWEYCPRSVTDELAYRARFQTWLERTIKCECTVDIFHQAFFNGTAHADGITSMYMLDMRNYETILDPQDKAGSLHAHETAAGYCYNINEHNRVAEEAAEHRKKMDREVRLEAQRQPLRSPSSPVANIYLRPVDIKDIPGLREIYNWYARNSYNSPNIHDLNEDEVQERIEDCRDANLPFIVAIDRRSAGTNSEKVFGYALAREFDKQPTGRFTAELELYVKNERTGMGIGKCLLDKLLEVCDATYMPKSGYLFEASREERSGYYPGGRRRLARLIFTMCYVDTLGITEHNRVKKWLKQYGKFEEQGMLRGVRVKNNHL